MKPHLAVQARARLQQIRQHLGVAGVRREEERIRVEQRLALRLTGVGAVRQQQAHGGRRLEVLRRHHQRRVLRLRSRVHVRAAIDQDLHLFRVRRRHHERRRAAGLRRRVRIESAVEQPLHIGRRSKQDRLGPRFDILRSDAGQRLGHDRFARAEGAREGHDGPRPALRGQKLIVSVRQAALEVRRAERRRRIESRRHVPGTVGRLRLQQVVDAAPPVAVRDGDTACVVQRDKRLRRRIRIARAAVERTPAAVGFLRGGERARKLLERTPIGARPLQPEQLDTSALPCRPDDATGAIDARARRASRLRSSASDGCKAEWPGRPGR